MRRFFSSYFSLTSVNRITFELLLPILILLFNFYILLGNYAFQFLTLFFAAFFYSYTYNTVKIFMQDMKEVVKSAELNHFMFRLEIVKDVKKLYEFYKNCTQKHSKHIEKW